MKKRILCITLAVTIIGLLLFSFAAVQISYDSSIENAKSYLKVYVGLFDDGYSFDNEGAAAFSQKLDGARVTLMDSSGNVIGESEQVEEIEINHADRPEVESAKSGGSGFAVRKSATLGKNMAYYCKSMQFGETVILVRVAIATASEWAMFVDVLPTIAVFLAIDVVACMIAAYVGTFLILRPVEKMAKEATLGKEVSTNYREIQSLAAILNERNRSLAFQMSELQNEKELVIKTKKSKDELISNITHEMNTPLTSIKGYAELLESGSLTPEQTALAYKTIYSQSERLTNLIASIINYNEIDSDDLPPYDVDFSSIVKETIAVVLPEAEKAEVTIVDCVESGVIVSGRHERLSELAGNLIRNAVRYNKRGGTVTVKLNEQLFSVEDTGIGIAEENMDKIFSRFFTVDKSHSGKNGGFGLGLAVCKRICNKAGWTIGVQSRLGEGSTFTVNFNKPRS